MSAKDASQARERMRRLRAAGPTNADKARNAAIRDLIERNRDQFERLLREHAGRITREDRDRQPN